MISIYFDLSENLIRYLHDACQLLWCLPVGRVSCALKFSQTEIDLPFERIPIGSDLRSNPCAPKQSSWASVKFVGRSVDPEYFRYSKVALRHGTCASASTPLRTTCFSEGQHRLISATISSPQRGWRPWFCA